MLKSDGLETLRAIYLKVYQQRIPLFILSKHIYHLYEVITSVYH